MNTLAQNSQKHRIYGIDFSGASDAGKKIWITGGTVEGSVLQVKSCGSAEGFLGAGQERGRCLAVLREFIAKEKDSAFGFDFPFGLPAILVKERSWEDFVTSFPEHYPSTEALRGKCRKAAHGYELKRVTDRESKAPFSPYNLRVHRQTYCGICDILNPLVKEQQACILPMQHPQHGKPWVLEICPASTLKKLLGVKKLTPYKGNDDKHREARIRMLETLANTAQVAFPDSVQSIAAGDSGGDALDSIVAAFATFRATRDIRSAAGISRDYALEGFIFV